ncbi:hypothetical protein A4P30_05755 [Staphylococcus aureus]|nr:hypothetical protein Y003_06800 [Staphylococcus aureus MUM475]KZX26378.1 hypothetical protein A4P30_05755 [Staphylococcus aureus]QOE85632.1 hypothetical protein D3O17_08145 [Staphylococcus aureus]
MIAKVIVDVASKSVDYKFDYIIPEQLESVIQPGVRVIVPFGPRTIQGYVMEVTAEPDAQLDVSKLKKNHRSERYTTRINIRINSFK